MNHEFTFDCESFGLKLGMLSWFLVTKLEMRVVVEYLAPLSEILVWLYLCTTLYRVSVTRLHSLSDKLLLPLPPPHKPKIYPNKSWRFLDGRVVIVSAQRVLESQILKCQLSLYKLTLCGTGFFIFFTFVHVPSCWLNGFVFIFSLAMRRSLFFQETKR